MPRGGHTCGYWPQGIGSPKDIFRSRWKQFYKRTYRERNGIFNSIDFVPPHPQLSYKVIKGEGEGEDSKKKVERFSIIKDFVSQPWRFQVHTKDLDDGFMRYKEHRGASAYHQYIAAAGDLLSPWYECHDEKHCDAILRCLDPGRKGGHSGLGLSETLEMEDSRGQEHFQPSYIRKIFNNVVVKGSDGADGTSKDDPQDNKVRKAFELEIFRLRHLYALLERREFLSPGIPRKPREDAGPRSGTNDSKLSKVADRGRFPFVDENASLVEDLTLKTIMRIRHRINSRRNPLRKEVAYQRKKWKAKYLRLKAILDEEAKVKAEQTVKVLQAAS
mmetsp:Transcript_7836/g.17209  ORF Transcript_7836/g.17209 Transcript_7836/m.17209 type:complete len:331 (-) Transcript_7836:12-1004(-)